MNVNTQALTRGAYRSGLILKKHAPTIAFVGGIAGVVTSTVMACKATLKLADELPEMKDQLDDVRRLNESTEGKHTRDIAYVYTKNTMTVVQLYAPSVIIGVASITALTGSHITLNRRNAGLTVGYAALSKAYDEYRDRVRNELGADLEADVYRGIRVEELDIDGDKKKTPVKVGNDRQSSVYARFFDECSTEWTKNAEINRNFIQCQQNYFNQKLIAHGHVFLNEIYDNLGLERSSAGQMVGWIYDGDGDNYIDFGITEIYNNRFVNGIERSILLDFNVDGVIYDKI